MSWDHDTTFELSKENESLKKRIRVLESLQKPAQIRSGLQTIKNIFNQLANNFPAIIHVLQGDHFVYVNSGFTSLTGYTLEDCSKLNFWDLVHPDYREMIREMVWAWQRGEEVVPVTELKIITKDGREIWVDHCASATAWADKPAITAIMHDLTESKLIEETMLLQRQKLQETYAELEDLYCELQTSQNSLIEINNRLQESEERLGLALWASDEGMWDWNPETGELYLSAEEVAILGYELGELSPHIQTWYDHVHPDDYWAVKQKYDLHRTGQTDYYEAEYRFRNKLGEWIWILDRGKIVKRNQDGKPTRMVGTKRNVTEQVQARMKLKASEERYRHLFEKSPIGLIKVDDKGYIVDANDYFVKMNGAPSRELVVGINVFAESNSRPDMAAVVQIINDQYIKSHFFPIEVEYISKWGRPLCMNYRIDPIFDHNQQFMYLIIACEEISERKRAETQIRYLSYNDSLTGLYNRAFFEEVLGSLINTKQLPLSIIIGDVNGLKMINDTFGYHCGDKLLETIAGILKDCCRPQDIIIRWGGDEFVILLPEASEAIAYQSIERIRAACLTSNPDPIQPSIALGGVSLNHIGQNIDMIMTEAEDIMYRNKLLESKSIRNSIIASLETTLHEKTFETREHAHRMQQLSLQFGRALMLPVNEIERLVLLAKLHDIGKIGIPDDILNKPATLSKSEWEAIKKHPEIGYRIVYSSYELIAIAEEVLSHHERWDGTGYPKGLKHDNIPLLARIVSIVDAYDVMTHVRSYKETISHEQALEEIARCSSSQFDPDLVKAFLSIFDHPKVETSA